jgi:hypothetical protein
MAAPWYAPAVRRSKLISAAQTSRAGGAQVSSRAPITAESAPRNAVDSSGRSTGAFAIVSVVLASCSAILIDYDKLSRDTNTVGPASDGSATLSDAGTNDDSPSDAGVSADATFSEDFDDDASLDERWTHLQFGPGTTLAKDSDDFRSPPKSLHVAFGDRTTAGTGRGATVTHDFGLVRSLRCSFHVLVVTPASNQYFDIAFLEASGEAIDLYQLRLALHAASTSVREDLAKTDGTCECPRPTTEATLPPIGPGWTNVEMETDFIASTVVRFDGTVVYKGPGGGFTPSFVDIKIGAVPHPTEPGAGELRFDDVVCFATP